MKEYWKVVATRDVKYEPFTLTDLLNWVGANVPTGTNKEDILFEIEVEQSFGYYDDIIIDATMELSIRAYK